MNCKLLLTIIALIGTTNAASCWSSSLGYDCCDDCNTLYTDESGDWGVKNNDWCGIPTSCKSNTSNASCWSKALGYDCCDDCNTLYTDDSGDWGVKNNDWCGIPQNCKSGNDKPNDSSNPSTNTDTQATSPISNTKKRVGKTTRYWDCCKPSCAWNYKANVSKEVNSCYRDGSIVSIPWITSGCGGGDAFMCNDQQPWAINDKLSYGFAAANISGSDEEHWCCACFKITFTSTSIAGKEMIVQVTNTGGDLGENHFDIQMPGGGLGLFDGCSPQFGVDASKWGERYGGLTSEAGCDNLPKVLQPGCHWRFGWFENADNPAMEFEEVECPAELIDITGCKRLA